MKQQIYDKLDELNVMLQQAKCEGELLTDAVNADVFDELNSLLNNFADAVEYYVD